MLFSIFFNNPVIVGQRANRLGIHLLAPTSQNSPVFSNYTATGPFIRTQGIQCSIYRASDVVFDLVQVSRNCGSTCEPPGRPVLVPMSQNSPVGSNSTAVKALYSYPGYTIVEI